MKAFEGSSFDLEDLFVARDDEDDLDDDLEDEDDEFDDEDLDLDEDFEDEEEEWEEEFEDLEDDEVSTSRRRRPDDWE
ncbi:MAG: hypothetical protein GWN99_19845 [Gemmatimonadetes bacterium]|uniref:Uncharacterized protein n=1 Tax=Candidatus Kutchimonas denitrificans TaxID=3056748 RepID=A0AAE5CCU3_9BACT|nr:hypothetical protein [Gemmatimonadota bacterium]NIR76458.1 hypothetical protein [Candidatus Kutchimonas denitrificans]NIS03276.1 hypothetical protein [Gemmatimonadota bacterium]NIT69137.1 hypothetical protein [Gemmatimonadota bacterium]NIU54529.1 hypothetical protein [Gemmatimonadota bacterium]